MLLRDAGELNIHRLGGGGGGGASAEMTLNLSQWAGHYPRHKGLSVSLSLSRSKGHTSHTSAVVDTPETPPPCLLPKGQRSEDRSCLFVSRSVVVLQTTT